MIKKLIRTSLVAILDQIRGNWEAPSLSLDSCFEEAANLWFNCYIDRRLAVNNYLTYFIMFMYIII
jgi:hypothetical protein